MFIAAATKSKLSESATVCLFRQIEMPPAAHHSFGETDPFRSIHYAIFRVQNGNTQPGTLRPMLLPLVDTDLNFRTGA